MCNSTTIAAAWGPATLRCTSGDRSQLFEVGRSERASGKAAEAIRSRAIGLHPVGLGTRDQRRK